MRRYWITVGALLALLVLGVFGYAVWPTPWRYGATLAVTDAVYPMRFHRFSGQGEVWLPRVGWTSLRSPATASADPLAGYTPDWRERRAR